MPDRLLKVRFHKIHVPRNRTRQFTTALGALFQADRNSRVIHHDDYYQFLEPLAGGLAQCFAFARERKDNWPHWMRPNGQIDQIQVTEDGFISEVSFYWITANNRLLVELHNRRGPSPNIFCEYFERWQRDQRRDLIVSIDCQKILDHDAYQRFLRLNSASVVRFKLEAAAPGIRIINEELGQNRLLGGLGALQDTGALSIEVRLSMKRSHDSLILGYIRDLVERLRDTDVAQALDVVGTTPEDGGRENLDLLGKRRLGYEFPVRTRTGYVDHQTILDVLQGGYEYHRDYLHQRILDDD